MAFIQRDGCNPCQIVNELLKCVENLNHLHSSYVRDCLSPLRLYQHQHTEEVIEVYTIIYSWIFPSITKVVEIEAEAVLLRSLAGSRKYSNAHFYQPCPSKQDLTKSYVNEIFFHITWYDYTWSLFLSYIHKLLNISSKKIHLAPMESLGDECVKLQQCSIQVPGKRKKELALVKRLLLVIINSVNLRETKPFPTLDCQPTHKRKVRHKKTSSLEENYIGTRKHPSYRS